MKNLFYDFLHFLQHNIMLFFSYILAFFTPLGSLLFWTGVMVILDLITGILKDKKINNAEIKSKKLRPTLLKGMGYMISLVVAMICQKIIAPEYEIIKAVFILVFSIETKSIDENIKEITGFSFFQPLEKYINNFIKKDNESNK